MTQKKKKDVELSKAAPAKRGTAADTQKALKGVKAEVSIFSEAGKKLKELATDFRTIETKEKIRRIGGLVALATLTWILTEEDADHYAKGQGQAGENETLEDTEAEKANAAAKKEAEAKVEEGEMTEEEMSQEFDPEADEVISKKQSATNMYAIRYYSEDGKKHPKPNRLARICMKEKALPSKFILERSYALFKDGVGTFEAFKKNVRDKLVHKSVKGQKERERQAAVILSCCAVGRFQILPVYHFKRMGWPTRGEEGLRAMYNYIRSTDRQIAVYKKILSGQWNRHKDVGLMAVEYYSGAGGVKYYKATEAEYKRNPNDPKFHEKEHGGHGSLHEYAAKARGLARKFESEIPGLQAIDYAAMAIEACETGKGVIYARAKKGQGIGIA